MTSDTTYYVFARFEETATHTAGSIVSSNSIKLYNNVALDRVLLEGYGSYGMIYIKQGESVTLKISADPSNANSWKEIAFNDDSGAATSNITISNEKLTQAPERPHRSPMAIPSRSPAFLGQSKFESKLPQCHTKCLRHMVCCCIR